MNDGKVFEFKVGLMSQFFQIFPSFRTFFENLIQISIKTLKNHT